MALPRNDGKPTSSLTASPRVFARRSVSLTPSLSGAVIITTAEPTFPAHSQSINVADADELPSAMIEAVVCERSLGADSDPTIVSPANVTSVTEPLMMKCWAPSLPPISVHPFVLDPVVPHLIVVRLTVMAIGEEGGTSKRVSGQRVMTGSLNSSPAAITPACRPSQVEKQSLGVGPGPGACVGSELGNAVGPS